MKARIALLLVALLMSSWSNSFDARARENSAYTVDWFAIDGGGNTFATGGAYTVGGTIGQHDVGLAAGGAYTLHGGFWQNTNSRVYLPLTIHYGFEFG